MKEFIQDLFNVIDAGYGTIITAMCSCLFHLKRNPEVMNKLKNELITKNFKKEVFKSTDFNTKTVVKIIKE